MFRYSLSWYIFAFTLLESIINTHLTVHDSNHGKFFPHLAPFKVPKTSLNDIKTHHKSSQFDFRFYHTQSEVFRQWSRCYPRGTLTIHYINFLCVLKSIFLLYHRKLHPDWGRFDYIKDWDSFYFVFFIGQQELMMQILNYSLNLNLHFLILNTGKTFKFGAIIISFYLIYRPLGVPHLEKVTLFNIDSNKSIDMTSISGSTVHFHSSFFEDKVCVITRLGCKRVLAKR